MKKILETLDALSKPQDNEKCSDGEYTSYRVWKKECRKEHPNCKIRGSEAAAKCIKDGGEFGSWDGSSGCITREMDESNKKPEVASPKKTKASSKEGSQNPPAASDSKTDQVSKKTPSNVHTSTSKAVTDALSGDASMYAASNKTKSRVSIQEGDEFFDFRDRKFDVTGPLSKVFDRFPFETRAFLKKGIIDDDLYHALYDYYAQNSLMPYGIMKGSDGDPYTWIVEKLKSEPTRFVKDGFPEDQVEAIIKRHRYEFKSFVKSGMLNSKDAFFHELYDYFNEICEIPYRIKKEGQAAILNLISGKLRWYCEMKDIPLSWHPDPEIIHTGPDNNYGRPNDDDDDDDDGIDVFNAIGVADTIERFLDEEVLMEDDAETIAREILDRLGYEDGLDYCFENGDLVIFGRRIARVVISALTQSHKLKFSPKVESYDGEEVRISLLDLPEIEDFTEEFNAEDDFAELEESITVTADSTDELISWLKRMREQDPTYPQ